MERQYIVVEEPGAFAVVGERGGSVDDPDVEGNSMVHTAIGLGGKIVDKR